MSIVKDSKLIFNTVILLKSGLNAVNFEIKCWPYLENTEKNKHFNGFL